MLIKIFDVPRGVGDEHDLWHRFCQVAEIRLIPLAGTHNYYWRVLRKS